jgi:hypothetical protein
MKIKFLLAALCFLTPGAYAADTGSKPGAATSNVPSAKAREQGPGVPEVSTEDGLKALWSLSPLLAQYDGIVQPMGNGYPPFKKWVLSTRQELTERMDFAKQGKSPAEVVLRANQSRPQFLKAIKAAQILAPIEADVSMLEKTIAQSSTCLASRQATLQQTDTKLKTAVQLAMGGMPVSVSTLGSAVAEAKAACP